jgi:acyl-CoA dehydrogenase
MNVATGRPSIVDEVRAIARDVAATHADDVDRNGRFPSETIDALREQRALAALVPSELGGGGVPFAVVAQCCLELGRFCGASAMVFAMHQIQVSVIVRHFNDSPWFVRYLTELSAEQRLISTGGDMSRSIAPLVPDATGGFGFEKQAPTVSYGAYADDYLITLRRSADSEEGDQVAVLARKDQIELEQTGTWDVLGMRGTCSPGYVVRGAVAADQVLPTPFARAAAESMVPVSHLLWSHLWLGIAEDAFDRARAFVRAAARRKPGEPLPAAQRLSRLSSELSMLRAEVDSGLRDFNADGPVSEREWLSTMAAALRFNNLKIAASEHAADICRGALDVSGIMGFKNDTPFSVGRHLRDTMSAALMIANERIHQTNAGLLLIAKEV